MSTQNSSTVILYFDSANKPRIRATLQKKGYQVKIATSLDEAAGLIKESTDPIFFVDFGGSDRKGDQCLKQLCTRTDIKAIPVIVAGERASRHEKDLNAHFPLATTLDNPYTDSDVVEAVVYTIETFSWAGSKEAPDEPASVAELEEDLKRQSIPEALFRHLSELKIVGKTLGGANYVESAAVKIEQVLPDNIEAKEAIEAMIAECGQGQRSHLCRSAFIGQSITSILEVDAALIDPMKAAHFLRAWAFIPGERDLIRQDYTQTDPLKRKAEVAALIRQSAAKVRDQLNIPHVANAINGMADILSKGEPLADENMALIASSLLISDLTDRVCYQNGSWDSRRAYRLLRKLRTGEASSGIHPKVLCGAIKFLSEAIISRPLALLLPLSVREDPDLLEQARQTRERVVSDYEAKVPLTCLYPGMRLARPLFAFDGRLVLSEGLIFDEDLIWRVWQLSALRPLNSPVVVLANTMSEGAGGSEVLLDSTGEKPPLSPPT